MGKKVVRVIGYVLCGLMLALCILMIVVSAAFGSSDVVGVFGYNIFIVRTDDVPTAPKDSAVIVQKCELNDVISGKLLLYTKSEDETPALGYAVDYFADNGVYYVNVLENGKEYTLPESDLIGRADYCSVALGAIIGFLKSPFGIFCAAVLPCIALILYDVLRAFAAKLPPPEVIPQVKNMPEDDPVRQTGISVSQDGKGTYSRNIVKSGAAADDVLFSYAARQKKVERNERPIIPLTDRNKIEQPVVRQNPKETVKSSSQSEIGFKIEPQPVSSAAAAKYIQQSIEKNISDKTDEKTEELDLTQKTDAFFTQSKVPQIRGLIPQKNQSNSEESRSSEQKTYPARTSSKRSTQIIANKRVEDLMKDEDDKRDKNRYEVDDILTGLSNKN